MEVSQHGGREEKIDKGENRPDTLDASEMRKREKYTEEKESQRAVSASKLRDSDTTQYKY